MKSLKPVRTFLVQNKEYKFSSANFRYILVSDSEGYTWSVRRRKTRLNRDVDESREIGEITYSLRDEFDCSSQVINFIEGLSEGEYMEILKTTNDFIWTEGFYFLSIAYLMEPGGNARLALQSLGYVKDEIDLKLTLTRPFKSMILVGLIGGLVIGVFSMLIMRRYSASLLAMGFIYGIFYSLIMDMMQKNQIKQHIDKRSRRLL